MSTTIKPLSKAEVEVLKLLACGFNNQTIADKQFISIKTVEHHISSLLNKVNIPEGMSVRVWLAVNAHKLKPPKYLG